MVQMELSNYLEGKYSNIMRAAYWYNQCRPYFQWGYDPCKSKSCYGECAIMCERSHEFRQPGFVLHYHGCNLNCRFCWAYGVRHKSEITKTSEEIVSQLICKLDILCKDTFIAKARIKPANICTIRLTGNEPTLQWNHIMNLLRILNEADSILKIQQSMSEFLQKPDADFWKHVHGLKILIQTNGVEIGKPDSTIDVVELGRFKNLDLNFEVSFKGVNHDLFAWLADSPKRFFDFQCKGFERLWKVRSENLHVFAELGINHCETVKGYPELGVRIVDQKGNPINFESCAKIFEDLVLGNTNLDYEENAFQEFGQINKDRARLVVQTYNKRTKETKNCLPSEF